MLINIAPERPPPMLSGVGLMYRLPNGRVLFSHVDLAVGPGDAIAIQGPSGTGKSTLLALLGGVLLPTEGTVTSSVTHPVPFAWILQTLNSLNARTVLSNATLLARLDGTPRELSTSRALDALNALDIGPLAPARSRQLSGGELQRLAVARALASSRPLILADEPTNQLDRHNARRVMQALVDCARTQERAVIIVTHDRDALPADARVLHLSEAGLVEV